MSILDSPIARLDGSAATLGEITGGKPALLVNVASKCGLTPQYAQLEQVHEKYADRGFTVVGFPCNQFGGQEPGSSEEIAEFCSVTYGVTFPLTEKIEVNGENRHEIYQALVTTPNEKGYVTDVEWNFEKFLVDGSGEIVARFRAGVLPDDPRVLTAVEALL
jgi:glutathione peroxidase